MSNFKKQLASQSTKHAWIDNCKATRLQDVIDEVSRAQAHYLHRGNDSKLYKRIASFSRRVAYYGTVLDVMVQHHPEYVSLAWGALKFIFGVRNYIYPLQCVSLIFFKVVLEHEKLGSTIATALSDIAEALSRIDLAERLYPTRKMTDTIVTLNCHILDFLGRAMDWYNSSSLSRSIQSITRPAALRYDDLVGEINKTINKVADLSASGSQAEQRDMHDEMRQESMSAQEFRSTVKKRLDQMQQQLNTLIQQKHSDGDLKAVQSQLSGVTTLIHQMSQKQMSSEQTLLQELVLTKQDIQTTQADIRHQLTEVQLDQAISFISATCVIKHQAAYEHAFLLRKVHRVASKKCAPFWDSRKLHTWDRATSHSSIIVMSSFSERLNVKDFYVGIIEQLLRSRIAVLWIVQPKDKGDGKYNLFDVLRSLILQALSRAPKMPTDVGISFRVRALEAASSTSDYTALLVDALSQIKLAYIIVDANSIPPESIEECHEVLQDISRRLTERNQDTIIKTMFLGYGFSRDLAIIDPRQQVVVKVTGASKRKGKRVPQAPLKSKAIYPRILR